MKVAFDIGKCPIFQNGEYYYPGLASLLALLGSCGRVIVYNSNGNISERDRRLLDRLINSFGDRILYSADGSGIDVAFG